MFINLVTFMRLASARTPRHVSPINKFLRLWGPLTSDGHDFVMGACNFITDLGERETMSNLGNLHRIASSGVRRKFPRRGPNHRRSQGRAKTAIPPPKRVENIVILCFERRFSKQNSVIRLKLNILVYTAKY